LTPVSRARRAQNEPWTLDKIQTQEIGGAKQEQESWQVPRKKASKKPTTNNAILIIIIFNIKG
jgi:hypothetical protein